MKDDRLLKIVLFGEPSRANKKNVFHKYEVVRKYKRKMDLLYRV